MNNKVELFPLKVVMAFLVFSELLVWIGPIDYDISNGALLFVYLLIVNLAFYWGYRLGIRKKKAIRPPVIPLFYIKVFLIFGFFLTIHNLYYLWSDRGIEVSFSNLVQSIMSPGDAYFSEAEIAVRQSPFHLFMSPFKFAAIPIGIYSWKKLPKIFRILVVLTCLIEVFAWMGIGTRKGLFDIIIIILFMIVASDTNMITNDSKYRRLKLFSVVFIFCFLLYFVFSGVSRAGETELTEVASRYGIKTVYSNNLPMWLYYPVASIHSYLCQGYYALSKGLEIGIKPLTVMGQSWFTINYSINHFEYNPLPFTYMQDLSLIGIDPWVNWHTIYLWLANDFSFIGVPFIIMLIGFLFARTWSDVVGKNVMAVPIFCLFLIMTMYFYANNQVISFQFLSFVFWLGIWVISKMITIRVS